MANSMRSISISFRSKRDKSSGQWVDSLSAKTEVEDTLSDEMDFNVTQDVEVKEGVRIITFKVTCNGNSVEPSNANGGNQGMIPELKPNAIANASDENKDIAELRKDVENLKLLHRGGDGIDEEQRVETTIQSDEFVYNAGAKQNSNSREIAVREKETQTDVEILNTCAGNIEELKFHEICGNKVEIDDNGKSIRNSKKARWYTSAFTNRTLQNGEMFKIIANEILNEGNSISIGVIDQSPNNCEIEKLMHKSKCSWGYDGKSIYINGKKTNSEYGKGTMINQVGDTFGVMRDQNGDLYFYINGENQGLAARGVPSNIYGFLELYAGASRVSIDDS